MVLVYMLTWIPSIYPSHLAYMLTWIPSIYPSHVSIYAYIYIPAPWILYGYIHLARWGTHPTPGKIHQRHRFTHRQHVGLLRVRGPGGNHKVGKHLATSLPPKMGKPTMGLEKRLVETKHGWDSRRHPKSFKKKQAEQKASILPGVCYLWGVHPVFSFDQDWNKWAHWVRMTAEDWTFLDGAQGLHESWLNW